MPQRPHILDYEPVLRGGSASDAKEPVDDWRSREDPPVVAVNAPKLEPPKPEQKVAAPQVKVTGSEQKTILKRGHGASYVGLVLFTIICYVRPYELSPSLKWMMTSAFWVAIVTLLIYVPTQLGLEGKFTIRPREINLALLLLLAGLISVPLASDRSRAWSGFVEYGKVILMFIVMVNVVRSEFRLRLLVLIVLLISCWISIAAVNDYRLGRLLLHGQRIEGVIGGLFDNPNDLALHLVTMIPIALGLFLSSRNPVGKLFYPICAMLMVTGIVASFSRGGFLGLVCAMGVMIWRLARRNRALLLAAAVLVFAGLIFVLPSDYRSRISTTGDGSSIARQNDLKRSINVTIHHPLWGVGMDNYVLFSNTDHATHNAYTQVSSEMGIPAMVIYVMFILAALKPLRKIGNEPPQGGNKNRLRYLAAGFEAGLAGYMVSSFFSSVAYLWYLYYLVGYAICLTRLYQADQAAQIGAAETGRTESVGRSVGHVWGPESAPKVSVG